MLKSPVWTPPCLCVFRLMPPAVTSAVTLPVIAAAPPPGAKPLPAMPPEQVRSPDTVSVLVMVVAGASMVTDCAFTVTLPEAVRAAFQIRRYGRDHAPPYAGLKIHPSNPLFSSALVLSLPKATNTEPAPGLPPLLIPSPRLTI